mgnify:CR=1 FL=1
MELGNMDGYFGNMEMESGKQEMEFGNSVVEFDNLIGYNKLDMNFVELEDNLCKVRIF